jgi:hypothetical protein
VKLALYVLGGVVAMLAFGGGVILVLELLKLLFGAVWGFGVFALALLVWMGGIFGWRVYLERQRRKP